MRFSAFGMEEELGVVTGSPVMNIADCSFPYLSRGFSFISSIDIPTIGNCILQHYNFYYDATNKKVYFQRIQSDNSVTLDNYYKPTFGFIIDGKDNRRFVTSVLTCINGKKVKKEVKFGDELISVNGTTLDKIDWSIWYKLHEADFIFGRDGKQYSLHLVRQGLEGLEGL